MTGLEHDWRERRAAMDGERQRRKRRGGQMNRDIVRRLVKRKKSRDGRLIKISISMFTLETDQTI